MTEPLEEDQYVQARRAKLARLRAAGIDPFPPRAGRTHTVADALAGFDALAARGDAIALAGRLMRLRIMGRAAFADLHDATGRLQLHLTQDHLGEEAYRLFRETADLGDIIGARGTLFRTKTGEPTLEVRSWSIYAKALRPLPEKWHGLVDPEARFRRRYLDLISNPKVRDLLTKRSQITREVRRFLDERGFIEAETPALQPLHGGAAARPFVTYHNALERQLYLRISLELYLKRLLIGGFEQVYEIGRVFRNEGIDRSHNPEFTLLEAYQAYADYTEIMQLVEQLVATVAERVLGGTTITHQDRTIDLAPPWPRVPLREAIARQTGIDYTEHPTLEALQAAVQAAGLRIEPQKTRAQLIDKLIDLAGAQTGNPVFFIDYPLELSPFAKLKPGCDDTVERFEAFAGGVELANAFTELNDPDDQYRRFLDQVRQAQAGDEEAHVMDLDFIEAMQYGMPPAGGLGIGIDRLAMLLLGAPNLREVIYFPMLRPEPRT